MGCGAGRVFRVGELLVRAMLAGRCNLVAPQFGADWQLRTQAPLRPGILGQVDSSPGRLRMAAICAQRAAGIDGLCSLTRPPNLGSDSPRSLAGPPVFLRAMISERRACADSDFICTGLKKPVRARYASPGASLRSVRGSASARVPDVRMGAPAGSGTPRYGEGDRGAPASVDATTSTHTSSSTSDRDPQTLRAGGRGLFEERAS